MPLINDQNAGQHTSITTTKVPPNNPSSGAQSFKLGIVSEAEGFKKLQFRELLPEATRDPSSPTARGVVTTVQPGHRQVCSQLPILTTFSRCLPSNKGLPCTCSHEDYNVVHNDYNFYCCFPNSGVYSVFQSTSKFPLPSLGPHMRPCRIAGAHHKRQHS